jgi:3-phosphoshikimate 1-carboxyvinyltransferase
MRERPIGGLVNALRQLGAKIEVINNHQSSICPPIKIMASGLSGGKTKISGNISSQFLSALLLTAPYAYTPVEIEITTELNSKPYIDMTLAVMSEFGVEIDRDGYNAFFIHPARYSPAPTYSIESDASAASYFFAAPVICGGTVCVKNISSKSNQGDIKFLDILSRMGCVVTEHENSIEVTGTAKLIGLDVSMRDISDTAQTLAMIAPFASSPTRIRGITTSRLKETDRISATCTELRKIGVRVDEHEDGMTIYPSKEFHHAVVQTYDDHRMAMAFSLIGLRVPGIVVENPGCVSKTFPNFFSVLETLR